MLKLSKKFIATILAVVLVLGLFPPIKAKAAAPVFVQYNADFSQDGYLDSKTVKTVNGHIQPYGWVSSTLYNGESYIPRVNGGVQIGSPESGVTSTSEKLPVITTNAQRFEQKSIIVKWTIKLASKNGSNVGATVKFSETDGSFFSTARNHLATMSNAVYENFYRNINGPYNKNGDGIGQSYYGVASTPTINTTDSKYVTTTSTDFVEKTGYAFVDTNKEVFAVAIIAMDNSGNTLIKDLKLDILNDTDVNNLCNLGPGVLPSAYTSLNGTSTFYTSVQSALDALPSSNHIVHLLRDSTVSNIIAKKSGKLDLNGCRITSSMVALTVNSGVTLQISGGGAIESTSTYGLSVANGADVTVDLAEAQKRYVGDSYVQAAYSYIYSVGSTAIANSGKLTITGYTGVYDNSTSDTIYYYGSAAELNINGGYIAYPVYGIPTLSSQSGYAIHNEGGKLNITGGIVGDPSKIGYAVFSHWANGNSASITTVSGGTIYGIQNGAAVSWGNSLAISGGDFYPGKTGDSLYTGGTDGTFSITGGTFEKTYPSSLASDYAFYPISSRYGVRIPYKTNVDVTGLAAAKIIGTSTLKLNSTTQPSLVGGDIQLNEGRNVVTVNSDSLEELSMAYTLPNGYTVTTNRNTRTSAGVVYFKPTTTADTVAVTIAAPIRALRISLGAWMSTTSGSANQDVANGTAITPVTIKASDGYILPASLTLTNGLTYTRNTGGANGDGITATISGTITGDVTAKLANSTLGAAKVGNIAYSSLPNAINAIGTADVSGNAVTLLQNVTLTGTNNFTQTATISGAYTITSNGTLTLGDGMSLSNSGITVGASNTIKLAANTVVPQITLGTNAYVSFSATPKKTYTIQPPSATNGFKIIDGTVGGNVAMTQADLAKITIVGIGSYAAYLSGGDIKIGAQSTVTFDATTNGGILSGSPSKSVVWGTTYGTLPTATPSSGNLFEGWYTTPATGGSRVQDETTVNISANTTLYARFTPDTDGNPVRIGAVGYPTLSAALAQVHVDNENTITTPNVTITIMHDITDDGYCYLDTDINVTIDGRGSQITFAYNSEKTGVNYQFDIIKGTMTIADLTLSGGKADRTRALVGLRGNATLNLESNTILRDIYSTGMGGAVAVSGTSTLNVNAGTVISDNKGSTGGGIAALSGTVNINGGKIYGNVSTDRTPQNGSVFHGDAILLYTTAGTTLNISGADYDITGDILVSSGKTVNLTSPMASGKYMVLTAISTTGAIVSGTGAIASYGRVKLTNSGLTIAKNSTTLDVASSAGIKAVLRGSAIDNEFLLGYTTIEAAVADIGKSFDATVYLVNDTTITAGVASSVKLATADRVVSGEYGTITTLQHFGADKKLNGVNIAVGNGGGENLTATLVNLASTQRDTVLSNIAASADYSTETKSSLTSQLTQLFATISNKIQTDATIYAQLESTTGGISNLQAFLANTVVHITTAISGGNGNITPSGYYAKGETVTLIITPENGYRFVAWNDGSSDVSTSLSYSFTATSDKSYTAMLKVSSDVATIGGTVYDLLEDAAAAAKNGDEIRLMRNFSFGSSPVNINQLGLTGATLNFNSNTYSGTSAINIAFGKGTVTNGTVECTVFNVTGGQLALNNLVVVGNLGISAASTVTIDGGRYDGSLTVAPGGSLKITAGYFTADPSAYVSAPLSAKAITVEGKNYYEVGHFIKFKLSKNGDGLLSKDGVVTTGESSSYLFGTSFSLAAASVGDYTFAYWQDGNNRAVSNDATYKLTLVSDTDITAVYTQQAVIMHTVEYHNYNGSVLQRQYMQVGDPITPPETPQRYGFTFLKWDTSVDDMKNSHESFTVRPVYKQNLKTYTVTVQGGTTPTAENVELSLVTVKADSPAAGTKFSHWESAGQKVSFDSTYTFSLIKDISLTAIYVPEATALEKEAILKVANVKASGDARSFVIQRSIAPDCIIIEHGLMLYDNTGDFTLNTAGITTAKSIDKARNGTYIVNKKNVQGKSWRVRGYAICVKGGKFFTVYSEIVDS